MTVTRPYRMQARAVAAEEATQRILDSTEELFWESPARPVTLAAVAERAGVSVHSIIRRFGGQQGLFEATLTRATARVSAQRSSAEATDLDSIVGVLVDHYEEHGDRVLALLALEHASAAVQETLDRGRELHAEWCERMFSAALGARHGSDRKRLLAQLIAICDVYTWLLLRRQRALSRRETERALAEMLAPLVGERSRS